MRCWTESRAAAISTGIRSFQARIPRSAARRGRRGAAARARAKQVVGLTAQGGVGHLAVFHPIDRMVLGAQQIEHRFAAHHAVFHRQQADGSDCLLRPLLAASSTSESMAAAGLESGAMKFSAAQLPLSPSRPRPPLPCSSDSTHWNSRLPPSASAPTVAALRSALFGRAGNWAGRIGAVDSTDGIDDSANTGIGAAATLDV